MRAHPQNCRGCAHNKYVHHSGRGLCLALSCDCSAFSDDLDEHVDQDHALVAEQDELRATWEHYRAGRAL